jgi:transcription elongation GreA/GreB family factor
MLEATALQGCARCEALRARRESGYCCAGTDQSNAARSDLPMAEATFGALRRQAAILDVVVKRLAPEAARQALENITHAEFFVASRQLAALERVLSIARVVEPDGCALLGSRVTLDPGDGQRFAVELAGPDRVDPAKGRISVDSPMGAALLGRRNGETVRFHTPAGYRTVTLTAIG